MRRLGFGLERGYVPARRGAEQAPVLAAKLGRALLAIACICAKGNVKGKAIFLAELGGGVTLSKVSVEPLFGSGRGL